MIRFLAHQLDTIALGKRGIACNCGRCRTAVNVNATELHDWKTNKGVSMKTPLCEGCKEKLGIVVKE